MLTKKNIRGAGEWLTILLFLLGIGTPLALTLLGQGTFDPQQENRNPAPMPELPRGMGELGEFAEGFEEYFDDVYGMRGELIKAHNQLQLSLFGHSKSKRVVVGKDGWLFFGDRRSTEYSRAAVPLTVEQLEAYRLELESHRDWLAERGIPFVMIVAPVKHTIYPEFLPERYNAGQRPTRREQLLEYLAANSDLQVLDLLPTVREAKGSGRLYHKTDTHWNLRGSWVAYREIMRNLKSVLPGLNAWPEEGVQWEATVTPGMDLALLLRMSDELPEEQFLVTVPGIPDLERVNTGGCADCSVPPSAMFITESSDREGPRAVVFGDSFFNNLRPFLAPHFSRLVGVPTHRIRRDVIEHEKPDIVLLELVERQLMFPRLLLAKKPSGGQ